MNVVNPKVRFSYDDYKSLPESMDKLYELLDGDIIMVPAPTTTHQRISRNLEFLLIRFVRDHELGEIFDAPVDVVLGEGNNREIVQPDVIFISRERKHIIFEEEIRGGPDLVVEILSTGTEERDRGYKKSLYARYGVREYWIIDPKGKTVETYSPEEDGFGLTAVSHNEDHITSNVFPDLHIKVTELFRED